jgi:hypothetical protein
MELEIEGIAGASSCVMRASDAVFPVPKVSDAMKSSYTAFSSLSALEGGLHLYL